MPTKKEEQTAANAVVHNYKDSVFRMVFSDKKFVVFYNGEEKQPERRILKLLDAYEIPTENPKLELIAVMLNINVGYNKKLMEQCRTLRDYATYVDRVRAYSKAMPIEKAVERAVNECIENDILKEFLLHQKSEVVKMSIYESFPNIMVDYRFLSLFHKKSYSS